MRCQCKKYKERGFGFVCLFSLKVSTKKEVADKGTEEVQAQNKYKKFPRQKMMCVAILLGEAWKKVWK